MFISSRYFFTIESALQLSKQVNRELKSSLRVGGSTIHALLPITTCKKFHKSRIAALAICDTSNDSYSNTGPMPMPKKTKRQAHNNGIYALNTNYSSRSFNAQWLHKLHANECTTGITMSRTQSARTLK